MTVSIYHHNKRAAVISATVPSKLFPVCPRFIATHQKDHIPARSSSGLTWHQFNLDPMFCQCVSSQYILGTACRLMVQSIDSDSPQCWQETICFCLYTSQLLLLLFCICGRDSGWMEIVIVDKTCSAIQCLHVLHACFFVFWSNVLAKLLAVRVYPFFYSSTEVVYFETVSLKI